MDKKAEYAKAKEEQEKIKLWKSEIKRLNEEITNTYNKVKDFGSAKFEETDSAIKAIERMKLVIGSYTRNLKKVGETIN
jgi:uncharacterized protein YlxW (UPF0749 family)